MQTLLTDLDGVLNTYKGDFKYALISTIRKETKESLSNLVDNNYEFNEDYPNTLTKIGNFLPWFIKTRILINTNTGDAA